MEHKYNQLSIDRYSTNLAKLLCDRYFVSNQTINGQQLISFTPIKQVNLFIIQELLFRWNQEMANLKSPYFDFEHEEVKEALVQFMNVLSRKILIKRPSFELLLNKAIADSLLWILDPARIFEEKFLKAQSEVSGLRLQTHLKYINYNKDYVKKFLDGLATGILPHGNVLNQFKTFLLRNSPDANALDGLLRELNNLLPLQKSELLPNSSVTYNTSEKTPTWEEAEPVAEAMPVPSKLTTEPTVTSTSRPATSVSTPELVKEPATAGSNLNEKFRLEKTTLNERLAKPVAATLAESQMSRKIESLKESISINQRFSFINELFNGENMEYHQVIKTLDEFKEAESAINYLTQELALKYDWSKKEEHVNKLLRLIERKFA